ncbi:MAG: MerR family transcriptional regulator [Dehalococcoidia bacterium]
MTSTGQIPANPEEKILVGELSRRTGLSTAAINYYVRFGVLPQPEKVSKTRALYSVDYVRQIEEIKKLQSEGLNLAAIKQIVSGDPGSRFSRSSSGSQQSSDLPTGPIPVDDFVAASGLSREAYDRLIEAGLVRSPRRDPDGNPAHDRRDLGAARGFARLLENGVSYEVLERHAEYEPLSKAEAVFLAEHLNSSRNSSADTAPVNVANAFSTVRSYLRSLQLDEAMPNWRNLGE